MSGLVCRLFACPSLPLMHCHCAFNPVMPGVNHCQSNELQWGLVLKHYSRLYQVWKTHESGTLWQGKIPSELYLKSNIACFFWRRGPWLLNDCYALVSSRRQVGSLADCFAGQIVSPITFALPWVGSSQNSRLQITQKHGNQIIGRSNYPWPLLFLHQPGSASINGRRNVRN